MRNMYELLAAEYYDAVRHPTCANFRTASKEIAQKWLADLPRIGDACEVGCGKSIFAELLHETGLPLERLHLTDSAPSMLRYSSDWVGDGAHLLVADATSLPFENDAIDTCIASLGDPYNEVDFWREISRVVAPHGHILFTTPSHEWASRYRGTGQTDPEAPVAEFTLQDGSVICAPSIVLPRDDQIALIEENKSLKVSDFQSYRFSELLAPQVSHKLYVTKNDDLPIVVGYLIQRLD